MVSEQPVVLGMIYSKLDPNELSLFQSHLDKYSNQITLIPYDEGSKEQCHPTVEGIFIYGLHKYINAEFMDLYPNLRVIATTSAGTDHIDVNEATKRGIKVGNVQNEVRDSTADHAFALLLAAARNVVEGDSICKSSSFDFKEHYFGQDVTGSTLGIVGLGGIGTGIAQRAKAFRMKTLYYSRTRKENIEHELGVEFSHSLKDLLKQADFVVLSACYTPQTHHMIGASELACMKPTAILINISRGGLINQDDLVTALKTGQIYAAGLDVTTPEPLPSGHPLLTLPNVTITPHVGTFTKKARECMLTTSVNNLMAGLKGEPLPSPVN